MEALFCQIRSQLELCHQQTAGGYHREGISLTYTKNKVALRHFPVVYLGIHDEKG